MIVEIDNKDILTYKKRRYKSVRLIALFCIALLFLSRKESNLLYGLIPVGFLFIVQYYKSSKHDKYLVTKIIIEDDRMQINYFLKSDELFIDGPLDEFSFVKKYEHLNRTPTPYLAIYQNTTLMIKQYQESIWSEKKMDEVVALLNLKKSVLSGVAS